VPSATKSVAQTEKKHRFHWATKGAGKHRSGEYGKKQLKTIKNREATTEQPANPSRLPLFRLLLVWGVSAAGLGLAVNLYQLQIVQSAVLLRKARQQQMVHLRPLSPPPGGGSQ